MNVAIANTPNLVGITGIARRLVQDGAMDEATARSAMANATEAKVPLAQWVAEKRLVAPAHLAAANAIEFGIPLIDVTAFDSAHHAIKLVSEELIQKHQVLPLFKRGGKLFVGTSNPTQTAALTEIQFHTNLVVEPVLVDDDQLRRTLDQWLNAASNLSGTFGGDDDEGLDNLEVGTDDDMGATVSPPYDDAETAPCHEAHDEAQRHPTRGWTAPYPTEWNQAYYQPLYPTSSSINSRAMSFSVTCTVQLTTSTRLGDAGPSYLARQPLHTTNPSQDFCHSGDIHMCPVQCQYSSASLTMCQTGEVKVLIPAPHTLHTGRNGA